MIKRLRCDVTFGDSLLFILGWTLLIIITFGLASPFFIFSLIKFMINKTTIEEL
ncbi:DUF898 family protein [Cetobacterium sp. 2A]|uniref:DUF6693 family protein n=1 Tax=Cetobacterium sp. 2A TaxID=2754723 RepID=UPI00163C7F4F|nr:DUF898 family protein [Cetobacterium sp. 2A]MBC2856954.1 DUF898 family protein [Cetobacterium sp. 2A]